jgi:hypothetical protein
MVQCSHWLWAGPGEGEGVAFGLHHLVQHGMLLVDGGSEADETRKQTGYVRERRLLGKFYLRSIQEA